MNKQQLDKKIAKLTEQYESRILQERLKFANSNNPFSVGEIIFSKTTCLEIEKIELHVEYGYPSCLYVGKELKKEGSYRVKSLTTALYQKYVDGKIVFTEIPIGVRKFKTKKTRIPYKFERNL